MTRNNKELRVPEKREIDRAAGESTREGPMYVPHVDIAENDEAIMVVADVPGAKREDIEIDLREGVLTLTAGVAALPDSWRPLYREQGVGGFTRRFTLGDRIDQEGISAALENGVLRLRLPKAKAHQPRRVAVH